MRSEGSLEEGLPAGGGRTWLFGKRRVGRGALGPSRPGAHRDTQQRAATLTQREAKLGSHRVGLPPSDFRTRAEKQIKLPAVVEGLQALALFDTGSEISILSKQFVESH